MFTRLVRYAAALVLLQYGFAKLNGAQFTILDSELDKPMGDVSGFWLTWYYFGFSPFYGTILALVQIGGAMLLTFRRTALLGACVLVPVLGNIVLIDVAYGIDLGATMVAFCLLMAMIGLIAPHREQLLALFWREGSGASAARRVAAWSVRVAMVALTFGLTFYIANYNNRAPTPIDGTWDVVSIEPEAARGQVPAVIFFEHNRAFMAVFKTADGRYDTHHFEVDREDKKLRMWESWIGKGAPLFDGSYTLASADLALHGTLEKVGEVDLQLRRRVGR